MSPSAPPPPAPRREEPAVYMVVALAIAAYAWILHRLVGAIVVFSVLIFATALTNMALIAAGRGARALRISRWGWLAAMLTALVVIGRPAAERDCRVATSSFWSLPQLAVCTDHKEEIRKSLHSHRFG
jgi:hypothetical protein